MTRHTTQDVEVRDLLRKVHHLLERLAPRDRLVFVLRRVEAMTVEEIAATMDISGRRRSVRSRTLVSDCRDGSKRIRLWRKRWTASWESRTDDRRR